MLWESTRLSSNIHTKRTSQENFAWGSIIDHEQHKREDLDPKIESISEESSIPM